MRSLAFAAALLVAALACSEVSAGCRQAVVLRQRGFAVVQPVALRQDAIVLRRGLFGGVRARRIRNAQILLPSSAVFSQGVRVNQTIVRQQVGGCVGGRCAVFFR